ncbi:MAG: DUF2066 domain-containing protein [Rickettsiales bacterium]|nr:DUF2066 domain-containing protein [Rickettsiales bacterium]
MQRTSGWGLASAVGLLVYLLAPDWAYSATLATIAVRAEAPDAVLAQQKALAQGESQALFEVLQAKDPKHVTEIISKITPEQRASLVKSVSVEHENARAGRYEADVTYVFDEKKISLLVTEQKGLVEEMSGHGLLILPVYYDGKQLLLWEGANYWRSAMARQTLERGQGRLVVPFGNPKDAMTVNSQVVLAGTKEPIIALAKRYGTANAVIATARLGEDNGIKQAEIRLRRPGQSTQEETVNLFTAESANETPEQLLRRASRETVDKLLALSNEFSLFAEPQSNKLNGRVLRAEYPSWQNWLLIRKQLEGLPGVEFVDIGAVSPEYAQVTLYYRGEENLVQQALDNRGFKVTAVKDFWTISYP